MAKTIKEMKQLLEQIDTIEELEQHEANLDNRKGVQQAIASRKSN